MNSFWGGIDFCAGTAKVNSPPESSWLREAVSTEAALIGSNFVIGASCPELIVVGTGLPERYIVADAQLHNLPELRGLLAQHQAPFPDSDAAVLLAAWERWGESLPSFVRGDFSFALYDPSHAKLLLCRDHLGAKPLFYWSSGTRFIFASNPNTLLQMPGVERRLNRRKLAAMAVPDGMHFYPDETFHEGINAVPPATLLTVDSSGVRLQRYWEPSPFAVTVPPNPEVAFEALRDLLFRSVENRIRGARSVSVYLSGGLDSSAIAAVAARCLERSNRTLTAIAAVVPEAHAECRDEREFVDEFAEWPNIRREYVTAEGRGPFDFLNRGELFELSFLHSSRHYLTEELDRTAAQLGSDLAFAGYRGELGATSHGAGYYTELAAGLKWNQLYSVLASMHSRTGRSPARALAADIRGQLFPYHGWCGPYPYLTDGFLALCDAKPFRRRLWPDHRMRQLQEVRLIQSKSGLNDWSLANSLVEVRSPLFDRNVIEFCLAAPGSLKVRDGFNRYLVRGALQGIVPDRILWRTGKAAFSPDYELRYNAQLPIALEFVAGIRRNDPIRAIVDVDRLERSIVPVAPGKRTNDSLVHVPSSLYLICFLRQFAEFRV